MPRYNQLKWNAITHPGLKRNNNEDCFLSSPETGLWLVADGMGGHEAGEVASAITRDTLDKLSQQGPQFSLVDAIQSAHIAILQSSENGIGVTGMGSTVVALCSHEKNYQIAWVGDSRAYLWTPSSRGGDLLRLTVDHSYVQMLFASGVIDVDELNSHPDKHIITQCLGIQELTEITVDITNRQWQKNQWIILCSDGLTDELSDDAIKIILAANSDSLGAVNQLLAAALEQGGRDNITLQIIESPVQQEQIANSLTSPMNEIKPIVGHGFSNRFIFAVTVIAILCVLYYLL